MKDKKRYLFTLIVAAGLGALGVKRPDVYANIAADAVDVVNGHTPQHKH